MDNRPVCLYNIPDMLLEFIDLKTPYRVLHAHMAPTALKPLHRHPNVWEMSLVVKGSGTKTVGDNVSAFSSGDAVLLPPNVPHLWTCDPADTDEHGNIETLVVFIRDDWLHALAGLTPSFWRMLAPLYETRDSIMLNGRDAIRLNAIFRRAENQPEAIRALRLIEAVHLFANAANALHLRHAEEVTGAEREREQLRIFIENNYMRPLTLERAARDNGFSRSRFCARFKELMGTTFVSYVNGMRIKRACSLLSRTPLSITEIAGTIGFSDLAYFNRQFRRRTGMTPTEWRRGGETKKPPVA